MKGLLDLAALKVAADNNSIDTVLVCLVDMQGRLMGKRFHVSHFLDSACEETHCCNHLLASDLAMYTADGYVATSWESGYGDYVMKPDLSTLRLVPWLEGTAIVLCDVLDHHTHEPVPHAPRQILKKQIQRLQELGFSAMMATELEFFLFNQTLDELRQERYMSFKPISGYNQDYHILQTTKDEHIMRRLRNGLHDAGIPVESSKGEAEIGQQELNIRYSEAMSSADHHSLAKHATKEIAWQQDHAATFLPKWHIDRAGSASHIHISLWKEGTNAFHNPDEEFGMSETMRQFVAGMLVHSSDYMVFLAPYINSYKRFVKDTFAPTKIAWTVDNRTSAFRMCGEGTKAIRIECRLPGSDVNPYLAQAALLAAGMDGIENKMTLSAPATGNLYKDTRTGNVPTNLRTAIDTLRSSTMLADAMGQAVIDHYLRAAQWEQESLDNAITQWEIARGFELA